MRIFLVTVLIIFLLAQVVSPSLRNLTKDLENGKHVFSAEIFGEYLMKLAMASTYVWLLVFYGYFHLFFNLLAELLKFGDRVFYKDWWNSSNVSAYWRLWNLPVHYWLGKYNTATDCTSIECLSHI
jgi:diacylglycerol O-acyltransferase-1